MTRRRVLRWVLIGVGLLALIPLGILICWWATASGSSDGSPELAAEWRDHLNQFPDPSSARAGDREIIIVTCSNGEWLFGRSQNSHGIWLRGGGTVVVKDSRGKTRAFFGHVCGSGHLGVGPAKDLQDLEKFYKLLREVGFKEHVFPQ